MIFFIPRKDISHIEICPYVWAAPLSKNLKSKKTAKGIYILCISTPKIIYLTNFAMVDEEINRVVNRFSVGSLGGQW